MIKEHENVVLTVDLPSGGLMAGDVGVVVHIYEGGKRPMRLNLSHLGNTVAVETLEAEKIRPIRAREMPHVRDMAAA
ncbi:MAG: DUF4926 domain-containing protein [Desulfovermiculus sp.]|nr:DUF4926 domain-containing protein [Desulfovermiculus sp.]